MNHPTAELTPCPHMRRALERIAQGKRGGPYLWYAKLHTLKCKQCSAALLALRRYFGQLERPIEAPSIDLDRLSKGLDQAER